MSPRYEELEAPRFSLETMGGREELVVRAQRKPLMMAFMLLPLGGWTIAGVSAITPLWSQGLQPDLLFWLAGWVLGEACILAPLCWMLFGSETVRVVGSDLEIGYRMLGLAKQKLFLGSQVRQLSACTPPPLHPDDQLSLPIIFGPAKSGSVKFSYGARTIYLATGLDEPEGQRIVDWLKRRLPATATGP